MKKVIFSLLTLLILSPNSFSQKGTDLRELFLAAESYFLFEEFNEALPLYLRIHRHYPDNDNINYKIGVCFLNNPYEKNKSISYLEQAVKNIDPKYKENNFKETGAPLESLFYLGNAYRVNNQLKQARNYYNLFLERMNPEIYDASLVRDQLDACNVAERLMKNPIDFDVSNLSEKINTRFADMNPVVSGDETRMAFISKLQFYDAVFFTEKIDGEWTPPRNIVPELGVDGDVYPTSMSFNGSEMFIYRNDDYIGNIYSTRFVNGKWTPLVKLDDNINTKYWESHASISKDGKTLYFSSNRKGGYGGLDIYKSERQTDGKWGPAKNLGNIINTKYNDDTPFISQNGDKIYFSSYGHHSMGGYDIFLSKKISDSVWAEPMNLGYPINTTDDDQFFVPIKNGAVAYYSRFTDQGFGRNDIFRYEVYDADNPRLFNIQGLIGFESDEGNPENIDISVVDIKDSDTLALVKPDTAGNFSFKIPLGNYNVIFDSDNFKKQILSLNLTPDTPHEGLILENPIHLELKPIVIPAKDISDYLTIKEDSLILVKDENPVKIKFNAKPGTIAEIEVTNDKNTIYSDSILVEKKRQSFEFIPEPGENTINIKLRDEDGNTTSESLTVVREVPVLETHISKNDSVINNPFDASKNQEKIVNQSISQNISEAEKLRIDMIAHSDGALNEFLNTIDTEKQNLISESDLIDYLKNSSKQNNYSEKEINESLLDSGKELNITDIISELAKNTTNPVLKELLLNMDPEKSQISTKDDLFKYLYIQSESNNFTDEDIDKLMKESFNQNEITEILSELQSISDGNLQAELSSLDPEAESIKDFSGIVNHLLTNQNDSNYSIEDVNTLVKNYLATNNENNKINLINQLRSNQVLNELLSELDAEQISSMSESELIVYIFEQGSKAGLNDSEIIVTILIETKPKAERVFDGINLTSSPGLKKYLFELEDIPPTALDLFKQLLTEAEKNDNFNKKDVITAFKKYLVNKELIDFINTAKKHSEGDLLKVLHELDPVNKNIHSKKDLIEYLLQLSENHNFTSDDVYRASIAAENELYVNSMLDRLIEMSEGGLKRALVELKESGRVISGIDELIDYLMANRQKYEYSTTDIFSLLEKLGDKIQLNPVSQLSEEKSNKKNKLQKGTIQTSLILLSLGFIIFILILFARKKKKEEKKAPKS